MVFMTGPLSDATLTHHEPGDRPRRQVEHGELARWLADRVPAITATWKDELPKGAGGPKRRLLERFSELIVRMIPLMVGARIDAITPVWDRTSALYGAFAEKRGLAAGEAIEEFHRLREIVLRDLHRNPPEGGEVSISLRDLLRLNRALDRAVAHASVGHTDALFFEFFGKDAGTPLLPSGDGVRATADEVEQLALEAGEALERATRSLENRSEH